MTMTTGELDYDTIFRLDPSGGSDGADEIRFPPISVILWIIFIILMPIILTNMLVCLFVLLYHQSITYHRVTFPVAINALSSIMYYIEEVLFVSCSHRLV